MPLYYQGRKGSLLAHFCTRYLKQHYCCPVIHLNKISSCPVAIPFNTVDCKLMMQAHLDPFEELYMLPTVQQDNR